MKSPDLLRGLLSKEVSRGELLKVAGFAGALATLTACSGNNYPENESASPSADIQRETADARPTPAPAETTQPTIELPDPAELISAEELREKLAFPNWQTIADEVKDSGDSEDGIGDKLAVTSTEILNDLTNPLLRVDEATIQQIRQQINLLAERAMENEEDETKKEETGEAEREAQTKKFANSLKEYVTGEFVKTAIADPTQGNIPRFLEWVKLRIENNSKLVLGTCGLKGALTKGDRFYREGELVTASNGRQSKYNEYPGSNKIVREIFHWTTDTNLNPEICQADYKILHPDQDKLEIQLDFEPPEKKNYDERMVLVDAFIRKFED